MYSLQRRCLVENNLKKRDVCVKDFNQFTSTYFDQAFCISECKLYLKRNLNFVGKFYCQSTLFISVKSNTVYPISNKYQICKLSIVSRKPRRAKLLLAEASLYQSFTTNRSFLPSPSFYRSSPSLLFPFLLSCL